MEQIKFAVIGAGMAGLACAAELPEDDVVIFEQSDRKGGLCKSFAIDGFTFDNAVHLSFTKQPDALEFFNKTKTIPHPPLAYNFYHGNYLKHPVVNNTSPLSAEEKTTLISSLIEREVRQPSNYREWLIASYGEEFYKTFYSVYTRKYWAEDAENLTTEWVGGRFANTDIRKILHGSYSEETGNDYYADTMNYPEAGGYECFLNNFPAREILYNKKLVKLDVADKILAFSDGSEYQYEYLASSIPLPELVRITSETEKLNTESQKLVATSMSLISVAFNKPDIAKYLWMYIYDEDISAARVYSPNLKSPNNAPKGCSSLQFEIYYNGIV
ncbi:O-antigen synthesis protein WbyH [Clostridia bacterium]|nr:O-antigen synthesis protein WbyH [Clostridia bacterium]